MVRYENNNIKLKDIDRPLLVINDFTIHGSSRFQEYGFLLYKEYYACMLSLNKRCNVEFYTDWKPFYFGPFSKSLEKDLNECIDNGLIQRVEAPTDSDETYTLSIKGCHRWISMLANIPEIEHIMKQVRSMQKISYYALLGQIYKKYPEFTIQS